MFKLQVKNNRDEILTLTNNPNYNVFKIEGLAPPVASINSSVNTTTDGVTINSARLEARNIVIYTTIEGAVEANRINLYRYFSPKKPITLYFTNGSREVFIEGVVELIECDLFSNKQVAQISVICPKSYFKSIKTLITEFNSFNALFNFPFSISAEGMEFSNINRTLRRTIINTGDAETGLIIDIYANGTVVNPVIYDVLNKTSIKLNYTMADSDRIVINTNVGNKSIHFISGGVSTNIIGHMDKGSKWLTLDVGDNVYTYTADEGEDNISMSFTTPLLYNGV